MKETIRQVFIRRVEEYLSEYPVGLPTAPALYSPASDEELAQLQSRSGVIWDSAYGDFLRITDGMGGFEPTVLGVRDWIPGGLGESALRFLDDLRDMGIPEDVGVNPEEPLFPVAANTDCSVAVFMGELAEGVSARFWWVGMGDSFYFEDFPAVLRWIAGLESGSPRDTLT
ncbi:hypothetical protein ABZ946_16255 [Streptomyces sp. NPDC046324]|uniref:hypothetical protein n=1 Tax=Streptomyces sp. NPDC046324 TaxID=3154915 RepID=UPI0033FB5318